VWYRKTQAVGYTAKPLKTLWKGRGTNLHIVPISMSNITPQRLCGIVIIQSPQTTMTAQSKMFATKYVRMYCQLQIGLAKQKQHAAWVVTNWQRIHSKVPEKEFMAEYEIRLLVAAKNSRLVN
jgi:hypothetical protein